MTIKALCIATDVDRPTAATFVGLRCRGVDLTVCCPRDAARRGELAAAGVPLLDLDVGKGFDRAAVRRLRAALLAGKFDILHVFTNAALQTAVFAVRGTPTRLIAYRGIVGNVSFFSPVSWLRFLNPRIDRIVCVADAVREYFLAMRPAFLRLPAERLVTIHKGHSLDWYTAEPADLTAAGIPAGAFTLVCVANYRPRKGIEVLVAALEGLPAELNAHLLLIGHMDEPRLTQRIASSPARERIHRLGFRADAPALVAACDVFVLPSIKREGLARSAIEAMAYGVAPIVTRCGGSPELVVDGVSGIVVPPGDAAALARAVERLHGDAALRRRYGAAARERIREAFDIEDTIAKTHALYGELAGA
jgi:glycosyltransferase involved in cell wall biosynthesis